MIIISTRKDFDDPSELSRDDYEAREIDLSTDRAKRTLSSKQLNDDLRGKRILLLVHGYNNEQFEVFDAFAMIEARITQQVDGAYDRVVGYSWPGGGRTTEWFGAKSRANAVARKFRRLLETLGTTTAALDIMSHSLGARVTLKALKETDRRDLIRNYYCTAPAVDNECLEPGEEFFHALSACERLFVFHSTKDGVLRTAYRGAEWDSALGLNGPEDWSYITRSPFARGVYVANCKKIVDHHGGYKRADALYNYIHAYQAKNPYRFRTL